MRLTGHFASKLVVVVALFALSAPAQPPLPPPDQAAQQQDDGPDPDSASRSVARLSVMNGDVSVRRGDNGDLVAAALNAPLVVGDRVLTGPNSRAEVQFDSANMIRLAPETEQPSELPRAQCPEQICLESRTDSALRTALCPR